MVKMRRKHRNLYFEDIGEKFDEWMSDYDVSRRTEAILAVLPSSFNGSALEIGCGTGAISKSLKPYLDNYIVTDISDNLARATGISLNCEWSTEDATNLSFGDSIFDLVVSSECIEHTPDPRKCIAEMMRVLKPGGTLILTTPNKLCWPVVRISQITRIRKFQGNENFLFPNQITFEILRSGGEVRFKTGCHLFPWHFSPLQPLLRIIDKYGRFLYPLMINQVVVAVRK